MKYLGIDFGTKRVGLALSDPDGRMALPHRTLERTTRDALFAEVLEIIEREQVGTVVLGLPLEAEPEPGAPGDEGGEALIVRQIRNFAASLGRRTDVPIRLMDESLTSFEAEEALREAGARGRKLKKALDSHAAARILQYYLDSPVREGE